MIKYQQNSSEMSRLTICFKGIHTDFSHISTTLKKSCGKIIVFCIDPEKMKEIDPRLFEKKNHEH